MNTRPLYPLPVQLRAYAHRTLKGGAIMAFALALLLASSAGLAQAPVKGPVVVIQTDRGDITLQLNKEKAPITVANFLAYIEKGHFRDTIFHRVIPGFMIQGGGFAAPSPDLSIEKQQQGDADEENAAILMGPEKPTRPPIKNESTNFLRNDRGTIAMARTSHPDSATAQFFINLNDNAFLNRRTNPPGYAVFGKVIGGMPVVDAIARVKTGQFQGHGDVPLQPVIIRNVALKSGG